MCTSERVFPSSSVSGWNHWCNNDFRSLWYLQELWASFLCVKHVKLKRQIQRAQCWTADCRLFDVHHCSMWTSAADTFSFFFVSFFKFWPVLSSNQCYCLNAKKIPNRFIFPSRLLVFLPCLSIWETYFILPLLLFFLFFIYLTENHLLRGKKTSKKKTTQKRNHSNNRHKHQ